MKQCVGFVLLLLASVTTASGAEPLTANTWRAVQGESVAAAKIDSMAWLAGAWAGAGLGGDTEEIWSAPRHGVMLGAFRLLKEGRPEFYELMVLQEVNGGVELRLKHFDARLRGWEAKDESVAFRYLGARDGRYYFEGLTFEPREDALTVYLAIRNRKSDAAREEVFRYLRQPDPASASRP